MIGNMHDRVERIWWRKAPPPWWLRAIEPLYAGISAVHLRRRAANVVQPPLPLISVGNITAGGSGKTPFVLWLAAALKAKGRRPVILCRGDGGNAAEPLVVQADSSATEVGDEAKMLAEISNCPVVAGHDRMAGSGMAEALGDLIILDDGFQYRRLGRCCDIVLIPADGIGNGHQIPAGPLREPIDALASADIIVRTGSRSEIADCKPLTGRNEQIWIRQPGRIIDTASGSITTPDSVYAVTAIARPQRFFNDLKSIGVRLAGSRSFPDHHPFTNRDVEALLRLDSNIAVTAKDAVKLAPLWPKDRPLWVLPLSAEAQPGLIETILQNLP